MSRDNGGSEYDAMIARAMSNPNPQLRAKLDAQARAERAELEERRARGELPPASKGVLAPSGTVDARTYVPQLSRMLGAAVAVPGGLTTESIDSFAPAMNQVVLAIHHSFTHDGGMGAAVGLLMSSQLAAIGGAIEAVRVLHQAELDELRAEFRAELDELRATKKGRAG